MRLIDADALLKEEIWAFEYGTFKPTTGWIVDGEAIEKAPTVKAIPIDWIYNWADFYKVLSAKRYDTIRLMLEEWEKENGKD